MKGFRIEQSTVDKAREKYGKSFTSTGDGAVIATGDDIIILKKGKDIVAWFIYSAYEERGMYFGRPKYSIENTGMYVVKGMRNKGIGKFLVRKYIDVFNKKYGAGFYCFTSWIVTRKGVRMAKYRDSLTINPDAHTNYYEIDSTY